MAILSRFSSDLARRVIPYTDPYTDIAQFNLPPTSKAMMHLCRRLVLTDSIVAPAIWKLANYPITDLKIEAATSQLRRDWEVLLNHHLKLKRFNQLMNLDFYTYGNALASVIFPFNKYLVCPKCNYEQLAKFAKYRFNRDGQYNYEGICPGCRSEKTFLVEDRAVFGAWNRVQLLRWPPLSMSINYVPYTGDKAYYHHIPKQIKALIKGGDPLYTATLPIEFIKAARLGKKIKVRADNIFHMARPGISDDGISFGPWGMPLMMPVVRDVYTMRILQKAQEAMAQNRILPLRFLWPLMGNQPTPHGGISMGRWRRRLESEVKLWIRDPNYIGISPIPLGMGTVGADARPMLLHQELMAMAEKIVVGMGIPKGFVFGDLQFSSASVTIRMIENEMLSSRVELRDFNDGFLKPKLQAYMDWPSARVGFTKLRMADDIQRLQILLQLHQVGKISDRDVLAEFGLDAQQQQNIRKYEMAQEHEVMKSNARVQAEAQGLAQLIAGKYAFETQQQAQELSRQAAELAAYEQAQSGGFTMEPTSQEAILGDLTGENANAGPVTLPEQAAQHAQEFAMMSPMEQNAQFNAIASSNPGYARIVQTLARRSGSNSIDMRPLPETQPPRREVAPI